MINNVTISQERYNELKLKADLCMRFKKAAEDALDVARESQEMAGRLISENDKLVRDLNTLSAQNGLLRGLCGNAEFKTEEPKKVVILKSEKKDKEITNAEKYKNELEWLEEVCAGTHSGIGFSLAVLKDSGNPANCYDISCDDCAFCRFDDKSPYSFMGCNECREYWLQQPVGEPEKKEGK